MHERAKHLKKRDDVIDKLFEAERAMPQAHVAQPDSSDRSLSITDRLRGIPKPPWRLALRLA
jgi:hypothetical protein